MALTAKEIYKSVLYELQKVEAPSFYVDDFNYFASKAIQMYVNVRYSQFESTQQLSDDLAPLIKRKVYVKTDLQQGLLLLPQDYMHLLSGELSLKALIKGRYSRIGEITKKPLKRIRVDVRPYASDNYYNKPSQRSPYYKIEGSSLRVLYGEPSAFELQSLEMEYLKKPAPFSLTQAQVDADTDSSQVSEFSQYSDREIISIITTIFLENIESQQRLQTQAATSRSIP